MDGFCAKQFTDFLNRVERLKSVRRHCVTADGEPETVAAHSWRTALMAYLLKDELGDADMDRVIRMCLIHDIGEAVTGDIPTFAKNAEQEETEKEAVANLLKGLPGPLKQELGELFSEMEAQETKEAKIYKALDRLEAVISHNESDIATWLPLEYELQQTYAAANVRGFPALEALQEEAVGRTKEKIAQKEKGQQTGQEENRQQTKAEEKRQRRQKKRERRAQTKAERREEIRSMTGLTGFVLLAVFVWLAIDQAGLYGFLLVWLFFGVAAASLALLFLGIWRGVRRKRCGMVFLFSLLGIIASVAWGAFLSTSWGLGLGPVFPL